MEKLNNVVKRNKAGREKKKLKKNKGKKDEKL